MSISRVGTSVMLLGFVFPGLAAARGDGPPPTPEKPPAALPEPMNDFSDSGAFSLYVNEEKLASIRFDWKVSGAFENHSELTIAGQTVRQSLKITPDADGRWQSMTAESPRGTVTVTREAGVARRTRNGKTITINLKPGTVLFDNFSPALISHAVRRFDKSRGGKQSIPVFVVPEVVIGATLERTGEVDRAVAGRDLKFTRYAYGLAGTDINVWADADGKVYLADVPAQHAAYVRDGFEILRRHEESDPLISEPTHEVKVEPNVGVPMRDGVKLATDLYRPADVERSPVILIRTPYKKEMSGLQGSYYARRGYVVAVQDCRGRFGSPGTWEPFIHEPEDGHDTVEWLAAQPCSNGRVGMIGGSYLGWVQWWAASAKPPHLVTIIPNVAPPDPFFNIPYEYGVFFLWGAIWWADVLESAATADASGAAMERIMDKKYLTLLKSLPVIELDKAVLGKENPYWRKWIEHPTNDSYWDQANFVDRLADVRIPVFHQSGWFDGDGIGTKLNYLALAAHGHATQKLTLGPWGHSDRASRRFRDRDFGPEAIIDLQRDYLRWFDHYLKGVDNGIDREPLVSLFVMGSNKWVRGPKYPLPETRFDKWYLASEGKANTSKGDGRLTREAPPDKSVADRYTYDPGDPTPDPRFYEEPEPKPGDPPRAAEEQKKRRDAYHEQVASSRQDMLVYVTEPFKEPYTFAGPVSAVLYASSSARDTDWFARLVEVDEKGQLFWLAEGKLRARFRESTHAPQLLEPDRVYEYHLDLWHTGLRVAAGRRLRVEISSASFPMFSRNLNTGGHNETETAYVPARQAIYHSKEYPSHLLLPALPEKPAGR